MLQVDFGAAYEGETRTHKLVIFNNGPDTLAYTASVGSSASMGEQRYGDTDSTDANNPHASFVAAARARAQARASAVHEPFSVTQSADEVAPFSKAAVMVKFAPRKAPPASGFHSIQSAQAAERSLRYVAAFEFGSGHGKPLLVPLSGTVIARALQVQPERLFFGDVPCDEHRHQPFQLTNATSAQPVHYRLRRALPHFTVEPPESTIAPAATLYAAIAFHPKALGNFEGNMILDILSPAGKIVEQVSVPVVGTSNVVGSAAPHVGGPDALPDDFKLAEKMASEEEVAKTMHGKPPRFARPKVWLQAAMRTCVARHKVNMMVVCNTVALRFQPVRTADALRSTMQHQVALLSVDLRLQACEAAGQLQSPRVGRGDEFSHSAQRAAAVAQHRAQYDSYLRRSRKQRSRLRTEAAVPPEEDRELGIKGTAGIGKGDKALQMQAEPLWLADDHLPATCTAFRGFSQAAAAATAPHAVCSEFALALSVYLCADRKNVCSLD